MLGNMQKKPESMTKEVKNSSEKDINQIISSLSHELRSPLSIISSNLQLLKNNPELDHEIREETFHLCELALTAVSRFLNDIQFINFSNKKELKKNPASFDVGVLIDEILSQPNASFYQSDRISVNLQMTSRQFCSDKTLLARIITALLDNAFKFSAEEVRLTVTDAPGQLSVEIEDNGYGIPEGELELIFTPFYRCENVKMISGTGLGLAIVKGAAECLNGNIFIDSVVLKGTRVKLIIPSDGC